MQTYKVLKLGMVMMLALTLTACASNDTEDMGDSSDNVDSSSNNSDSNNGSSADPSGAGSSEGLTATQIRERDSAIQMTVFYFEFDRSDLSAEARAALVHHANYLKGNSSGNYRLEGHADERGTRGYNLALGERRAQAIERYLQVQGVSSSQLETISYGEENPVATGTTDASYSRNRRVEIH